MADISITAANVKAGSNAIVAQGIAGASITAGQAVHRNAAGKFILSDNDGAGLQQMFGISIHAAATDQPIALQTGGDVMIGATLIPGTAYWLSGTGGGICPIADVTTGDDPILIGIAKSASLLMMKLADPNVTL